MGKKLLVGLDGCAVAETTLPYVALFARAHRATAVLVRVVPSSSGRSTYESGSNANQADGGLGDEPGETLEELRAIYEAQRYLHAIGVRLGLFGVVVETVVAVGDPATVLVEEARRHQVEMVILATHGRTGIGRWIYGSVAHRVMHETDIPVLLVPPGCLRSDDVVRASQTVHEPSAISQDLATA